MDKDRFIVPGIVLFCVLATWELTLRIADIPAYVLPRPFQILAAIFDPRTQLVKHASATLGESLIGFLLGSFVGMSLGILLAESRSARLAILPYVIGSNAVPIIAIAPLVVMWFGYGFASRAIVAAFLCFFPICINTYRGLESADVHFRELFDVYGATRSQYLLKARLPHALPFIIAGAKLNATYAVIGAVVAEFIGTTTGLGHGMLNALYNTDIPRLWAYLVVSIMMGMCFYGCIWLAEIRFNNRYK